ncbi:MAG: two-component system, sensor histidine kinase and response regulator [Pyrinomonadaceae bacterium]|nr:two-component system, sensor histidine kinase and response regulator [Pyrinomonadaceae bacterium]
MSNAAQSSNAAPHQPRRDARSTARRVLVIAHSPAGELLPARLNAAGYEVRAARAVQAAAAVAEFAPHVALVEAGGGRGGGGAEGLEVAARLRAERATAALPLVLLFERADADLRAQAVRLGADDYFALATPPAEIAARLDALFWRAEAGRRTAALAALERRAEIDDFLQLLEGVRADAGEGATGTLALIADAGVGVGGANAETQTLAAAHDFFRVNLRRVDAVAFYGPTLLLVYLPQKTARAAHADLARLSKEFQTTQATVSGSLDIGLASFPADGTEIESLIEQAEAALQQTHPTDAQAHAQESQVGTSPARRPAVETAGVDDGGATAPLASHGSDAPRPDATAERNARVDFSPSRAVRESKQTDMETSMMPAGGGAGATAGQGTLAQAAADAAARERERRTRGALMPRRLLLTISDPARMAQINLLLRSAGYEVRAAFDGLQAINLLRIERPDLLVIEDALYGIDGLEALRRLHRQHHERLPLPVVLLLSNTPERERVRAEAQRLGARGFVVVPYDPEELLDCVRTVGITD